MRWLFLSLLLAPAARHDPLPGLDASAASSIGAVAEPARVERDADRVELRSGAKLQGRVVYQDDVQLILREGSRERTIPMKDVKSVVSRASSSREVLQRWLELDPKELQRIRDLAQYCKRVDLPDDAQIFQRYVLSMLPEDEDAHAALGHTQRANGWCERDGSKWVEWAKIDALRASWKTPWDLRTSHYRLRANVPARDAIGVLIDLECFYFAFHQLFGRELQLRESLEPLEAHVHGDAESFPVANVGRAAYFDTAIVRLVVDASKGIQRSVVIHEAVHQLLFDTATRTAAARGDVPGWLDEGLAEYMAWGMKGPSGRAKFDAQNISREHFGRHASSPERLSLARVLALQTADFLAPKSELKYAQSYTLVHFCLQGEGERYRARFFEFLRGAYKGQGSPTHFKDAMGVSEDAFEKAWNAYVSRGGDAR